MNTIHRESTKMRIKSLLNIGNLKAGDIIEVYKKNNQWHYNAAGKTYTFFISHLRNENCFEILDQYIDWHLITYDIGNPYICKTYKELQRIKRKYGKSIHKVNSSYIPEYHVSNKEAHNEKWIID